MDTQIMTLSLPNKGSYQAGDRLFEALGINWVNNRRDLARRLSANAD
jgi:hypothetical protein